MRRLLVIAMATALFLSIAVGIAAALDSAAWFGEVDGSMVATDTGHAGLTVDFDITTNPKEKNWTKARGWGHYEYDGNAFRLRVTHACVNSVDGTATVWGRAKVTSGEFSAVDGMLVKGDKAYGVLSLLDRDDIVSARAGIAADFFAGGQLNSLAIMVAEQCEYPHPLSGARFPATGLGTLDFMAE